MKNKFLKYCDMFRKELDDLQNSIDKCTCTLEYLGNTYSYELANIGFELGYAGWYFNKIDNFEELKNDFLLMIMENETIDNCYNEKELNKIEERILNCKENWEV